MYLSLSVLSRPVHIFCIAVSSSQLNRIVVSWRIAFLQRCLYTFRLTNLAPTFSPSFLYGAKRRRREARISYCWYITVCTYMVCSDCGKLRSSILLLHLSTLDLSFYDMICNWIISWRILIILNRLASYIWTYWYSSCTRFILLI